MPKPAGPITVGRVNWRLELKTLAYMLLILAVTVVPMVLMGGKV